MGVDFCHDKCVSVLITFVAKRENTKKCGIKRQKLKINLTVTDVAKKIHLIKFSNNYVPLTHQWTIQELQTLEIRSLWWNMKPPGVKKMLNWAFLQKTENDVRNVCSESRKKNRTMRLTLGSSELMFKQLSVQLKSEDVNTNRKNGDIILDLCCNLFNKFRCQLQNKKRLENKSVALPASCCISDDDLGHNKRCQHIKNETPP